MSLSRRRAMSLPVRNLQPLALHIADYTLSLTDGAITIGGVNGGLSITTTKLRMTHRVKQNNLS
jgi:hypothetical protein